MVGARGVLPSGGPVSTDGPCGVPGRRPVPGAGEGDLGRAVRGACMSNVPPSVASPLLWAVTLAGVLFFFAVDFVLTRRAHAAPAALTQRVLLYGIAGALVLRGIFIAIGAAAVQTVAWTFLIFGGILLFTAVKILKDTVTGTGHEVDVSSLRSVRLVRRLMPVTDDYEGLHLSVRRAGRRALTPLALVVVAVFGTDVVFAVDSIPAVYGVTQDPYLVFTANAFSLFGLRALYFVLQSTLSKLVHLGYGLAVILAFIGVKLILHWAHGTWKWLPEIPTPLSLAVIVVTLVTVTFTSLYAGRRRASAPAPDRVDLSLR